MSSYHDEASLSAAARAAAAPAAGGGKAKAKSKSKNQARSKRRRRGSSSSSSGGGAGAGAGGGGAGKQRPKKKAARETKPHRIAMRNFVVHTYSHVYLAGAELIAAIKASDWSTFFQHWSEGKLCGARRRRAAPTARAGIEDGPIF